MHATLVCSTNETDDTLNDNSTPDALLYKKKKDFIKKNIHKITMCIGDTSSF